MRYAVLLAVTMAFPASAAPVPTPTWMTGERLLALITFPSGAKNNFDLTPSQYLDAERARLYIEGVHDTTAGKSWCYKEPYPPAPDTVREAVEIALRKIPPSELKRNAADIIVEVWRNRWPCDDAGKAR